MIQNNIVVSVPRYPQTRILPPGVTYTTLETTGLNAITAFSHRFPEYQTETIHMLKT